MGGEVSQFLSLVGGVKRESVHIESAAVTLGEYIHRSGSGIKHRVAVLAGAVCKIGVAPCASVIAPYVACHRGGMMLAPLILEAFHIGVKHRFAVGRERKARGRSAEHLPRCPARHRHRI